MEELNDIRKYKKVFCLGIGGIGLSALARILRTIGLNVSGSDHEENKVTKDLARDGFDIIIGQAASLVPADIDLVIYSVAIADYAPGILASLEQRGTLRMLTYPEAVGMITRGKRTIAISGTHGKTTTTSMVTEIFFDAGIDPSAIVGSIMSRFKSNALVGASDIFILEACEYERSFLHYYPEILVITNIDEDHLDYYKDLHDIQNAFNELARRVPASGFIICDMRDKKTTDALDGVTATIIDYTDNMHTLPELLVPGEYNRKNAAAALAVADMLKIDKDQAAKTLSSFTGTWRRFEYKGKTVHGAVVYDDYAHHPTEIQSLLKGVRERYPGSKVIACFEPHLFSRTKMLFDEFAISFKDADEVCLLPIYYAREERDGSITSDDLAHAIKQNGTVARTFESQEMLAAHILYSANKGDVILTIGAGPITNIGTKIIGGTK